MRRISLSACAVASTLRRSLAPSDVIHKAVQDAYLLDANRQFSNLYLPKKLQRYLSKWVGNGIYNAVFDNVEDSPSLSRLQCFDFQGANNKQYADLIEPLMVWLLRRIIDVLYSPANLGTVQSVGNAIAFDTDSGRDLRTVRRQGRVAA